MREAYKQPEPVLPTPQLEVKTMIIPRPDLQLNLLTNSELIGSHNFFLLLTSSPAGKNIQNCHRKGPYACR
jgi:hypothetical protein